MVSKASDDFPEPDSPVNTTSLSRGITRSTFLRLCSRAPRTAMTRASGWAGAWSNRSSREAIVKPCRAGGTHRKAKGHPHLVRRESEITMPIRRAEGRTKEQSVPKPPLKCPALRLADEEVAERLDSRHRTHFFGIDEIAVERRHLHLAEDLREPAGPVDRIGRQHADADARFDGDLKSGDVVDHAVIWPRVSRLAARRRQPVHGREVGRLIAPERHDAMLVEILEPPRFAEALDVIARGVSMEMQREQAALDQIGLFRAAQPDPDVGLTHGKIKVFVGENQLQSDLRVKVEELGDALRKPDGPEADRGGDLQRSRRAFTRLDQAGAGRLKAHLDVARRAVEQIALFGQDEPARMSMKQGRAQLAFERADLAADRRLA